MKIRVNLHWIKVDSPEKLHEIPIVDEQTIKNNLSVYAVTRCQTKKDDVSKTPGSKLYDVSSLVRLHNPNPKPGLNGKLLKDDLWFIWKFVYCFVNCSLNLSKNICVYFCVKLSNSVEQKDMI